MLTFDVDALLAGAWVGVEVHLDADLPNSAFLRGAWGRDTGEGGEEGGVGRGGTGVYVCSTVNILILVCLLKDLSFVCMNIFSVRFDGKIGLSVEKMLITF